MSEPASETAAASAIRLNTLIADVPGVRALQARRLAKLDLYYVADLLRHFPRRYEFEHEETTIDALAVGAVGSARGELSSVQWVPGGRGRYGGRGPKGRFNALLEDDAGKLHLVWFGAHWLQDKLHAGSRIRVQGDVKTYLNNKQMVNPRWWSLDTHEGGEAMPEAPPAEAKLRPVYPATDQVPSAAIEALIGEVFYWYYF